jgi:inner membrane protein
MICFAGYFTHAPLDCTTTYGTLYFWPVSEYRVSLSYVSVVDPVYTLPLLVFVIAAALRARPLLARVGLAYSLSYLALGAFQNVRAEQVLTRITTARGHVPKRRDVFSTFMNQVTWRSLYEAEGRIFADQIRVPLVGAPCVTQGASLVPLEPPSPAAGPGEKRGQRLLRWFSSGWVARDPDNPELMGDIRYSVVPGGTRPFWGVVVDEHDTPHWVSTRAERKIGLSSVLELIFDTPEGSVCGDAIDTRVQ